MLTFTLLFLGWSLTGADEPEPRACHSFAYHEGLGEVVLFGGATACGTRGIDEQKLWGWNGTRWSVLADGGPSPREDALLAYDAGRKVLVLHGGRTRTSVHADTWEWDGTTWVRRTTLGLPTGGGPMVFDSRRNHSVMFGTQTWEYFAPVDVVGPGHPGGGLPISAATEPRINTTFCLRFPSSLGGGLMLFGLAPRRSTPFPVGTPIFCATGSVHVDTLLVQQASGNPASACIPIPADASLVGGAFCMQGMDLEAGGCLRLSDAAVVVLMP
jgi:hypothetical protein